MWINEKKVKIENIVTENGKIVKHEDCPVKDGLGDSTIWKCTFENGEILEIEFMGEEFSSIVNNVL